MTPDEHWKALGTGTSLNTRQKLLACWPLWLLMALLLALAAMWDLAAYVMPVSPSRGFPPAGIAEQLLMSWLTTRALPVMLALCLIIWLAVIFYRHSKN